MSKNVWCLLAVAVAGLGATPAWAGETRACCFPGGVCENLPEEVCNNLGGDFQADGKGCGDQVCPANPPDPTGSCCFLGGLCIEGFTELNCVGAGGTYQGDDIGCEDMLCGPVGACCVPQGCFSSGPFDCDLAGGTYMGDGTDCSITCPDDGACCLGTDAGGCVIVGPKVCQAMGGVYRGDGATCVACTPPPIRACCFPGGPCDDLTEEACNNLGGNFQADGKGCGDQVCPSDPPDPTGSCCFLDGLCIEGFTEVNCGGAGGTYQGDGIGCEDMVCGPYGACCVPQATCFVSSLFDCTLAGGSFQGDGTNCSIICPPTGSCCFPTGVCIDDFTALDCVAAGGTYGGDALGCDEAVCHAVGACCFPLMGCVELSEEECGRSGGAYEGDATSCAVTVCPEPLCGLESIAIEGLEDGAFGARIHVRAFRNGCVEHNVYTPADGFTGWSPVPNPGGATDCDCDDDATADIVGLESVDVIAFDSPPGARMYVRGFADGRIEQNIYTPAAGYSGWIQLPHDDAVAAGCTDDCRVESLEVVALNGLSGPRLFVRAWSFGLIEQCVYTPGDGYLGWSEVPYLTAPFGGDVVGASPVESIAASASGRLYEDRVFVVGLQNRHVYQNLYSPESGYSGWTRVPNPDDGGLPVGGEDGGPLESVDVLLLDEPPGTVVYLRGRANGRVQQNIYTLAAGFTGWSGLPGGDGGAQGEGPLESCVVEAFNGLFGPRVFLRGFESGLVQQNVYTPVEGFTGWSDIPAP